MFMKLEDIEDKFKSLGVENVTGILDVTGIPKLHFTYDFGSPKTSLSRKARIKLERDIEKFVKKYPNAVYAKGYDSDDGYVLACEPKEFKPSSKITHPYRTYESGSFEYRTIIFNVKEPKEIMLAICP